jgi:DNA-binding LacI/PurR family transcriptional regulator
MPLKRPTHRDIAQVAGVTHVTVSLALRGHLSIPKSTRDRIAEIAKQIGYRPDPALQALMVYRRGAKASSYQGTLAWINNFRTNPDQLQLRFGNYFFGARERCTELGYQLEEFRLVDLDMSFERLSKILRTRNIQGILLPPQSQQRHIAKNTFDWENFSLVAFGHSLFRPQLDLVTNAQFRSGRLAVRKLRSLGYRRIGYIAESEFDERTEQNFLAGFLIEQRRFLPSEQLPTYLLRKASEADRERGFRKWFTQQKPDAVVIVGGVCPPWLPLIPSFKRHDCGWALLDVPENSTEISGVNQNNKIIGRIAVDTLIAKIHANERGIPSTPRRILVEGRWVMGTTAPRMTGSPRSRTASISLLSSE